MSDASASPSFVRTRTCISAYELQHDSNFRVSSCDRFTFSNFPEWIHSAKFFSKTAFWFWDIVTYASAISSVSMVVQILEQMLFLVSFNPLISSCILQSQFLHKNSNLFPLTRRDLRHTQLIELRYCL